MTRLIEAWLLDTKERLQTYDLRLLETTGLTLLALAAKANHLSVEQLQEKASSCKVAVIPITAGEGVIGSFASSVSEIIAHLGFRTMVTSATDVSGFYEAMLHGADLLFFADDHRFLGYDCATRNLAENDRSTAMGYLTALSAACGGIQGREVLLLGHGRVGKLMLPLLLKSGAKPKVYDRDPEAIKDLPPSMIHPDGTDFTGFSLMIDLTSEGDWIQNDMLAEEVFLAAPGVPCSFTKETVKKHQQRLIHDCLEIGTATMVGALCK